MGNQNGMKISGLDIYAMEIKSTVRISGFRVIGSYLWCKGVTKKRSTIDDNSIGITRLGISRLEVIGSSLYCEGVIKKRSTIDNNHIGTIGMIMSGLGETSLVCIIIDFYNAVEALLKVYPLVFLESLPYY